MKDSFKKYGSLTNHYVKGYVAGLMVNMKETTDKTKWVVTEKVHGSNFSLIAVRDDKEKEGWKLKAGKRTSYLDLEEDNPSFFPEDSKDILVKKYTPCMGKLWELVNKEETKDKILKVIVYGEFFGGFYPEEKKKPFKRAIQRGVFYTDQYDFYAFDIRIVFENEKGEEYNKWVTYKDAVEYWKHSEFPIVAHPLRIGTFRECMDYDIRHPTTIPEKYFGLKPLKTGCHRFVHNDNICEGVVIKPYDSILRFKNNRVIIKMKNNDFQEVNIKPKKVKAMPKTNYYLDPKVKKTWGAMYNYITTQRIDNVVSKIGEINQKNLSKLIGMFSKDVLEEFVKENPEMMENLTKDQKKTVKKHLGQTANPFVHKWFIQYKSDEQ